MGDYQEIDPEEVPHDAEVDFVEWTDAFQFSVYLETPDGDKYNVSANVLQAWEHEANGDS